MAAKTRPPVLTRSRPGAWARRFIAALLVTGLLLGGALPARAQGGSYILATATTGGTYYPVGVALATLVTLKLEPEMGVRLSAISSAGSVENLKLLRKNEVQFALLQGLFGAWAWRGEGAVAHAGAHENLRAITMLWQNVEHFVLRADLAPSGTIADMAALGGARFSIGSRNSGTEHSGRVILTNLGIDPDTLNLAYLGYGASSDALRNATVVGMNTPAGPPVGAVIRAAAIMGEDLRILDFTPEQAVAADAGMGLWTPYLIPAGTYPGQDSAVNTIAQPNILVVDAGIDEATVYAITKTIYENLGFLQSVHKATRAMALDKAIVGLPLPLHPGAERYYREQGLTIPERLEAP
jgi:TRAP transporter TAXI family solute receptor